jgi:hypothetical protein
MYDEQTTEPEYKGKQIPMRTGTFGEYAAANSESELLSKAFRIYVKTRRLI